MNSNGHDSRGIANIFVRKAEEARRGLTTMSLLKYVYFAHGWTLGYTGEPLICHPVQAWRFGPVVPEVYYEFRSDTRGVRGISKKYPEPDLEGMQKLLVDDVYKQYSRYDAFDLSRMTHDPGAPWYPYRTTRRAEIPNEEIREYYSGLVAKVKARRAAAESSR